MQVRVGVGVLIEKEGKVLLGRRKNAHGHGSWAPPGGHLEFMESLEECARREVAEETGVHIENLRHGPYTNDIFMEENKHYLTVFMLADYLAGEPEVLEPEKCECWQWFAWDDLPEQLFAPFEKLKRSETLSHNSNFFSSDQ